MDEIAGIQCSVIDLQYAVEKMQFFDARMRVSGIMTFDLAILALHHKHLAGAAAYSERLRKRNPTLPILLLLDAGVFVPRGTLSQSMETGSPFEMMERVAEMLAGSAHIRELPERFAA